MLECALLQNPWKGISQVEILQRISEHGSRDLVRRGGQHMSSAFQDMVANCLRIESSTRGCAEELLGSRWFSNCSVQSLANAVHIVHEYVKAANMVPLP